MWAEWRRQLTLNQFITVGSSPTMPTKFKTICPHRLRWLDRHPLKVEEADRHRLGTPNLMAWVHQRLGGMTVYHLRNCRAGSTPVQVAILMLSLAWCVWRESWPNREVEKYGDFGHCIPFESDAGRQYKWTVAPGRVSWALNPTSVSSSLTRFSNLNRM